MKKALLLIVVFVCSGIFLNAQNPPPDPPEFPMGDIQIDACLGVFTDSQGAAANYLPGETFTTTICSPFPTDRSFVNFTTFDLAPGDVLIAYDGDSASSPFLGAFGSFLAPNLVEASLANTSGCITFVFTSNAVSPTAAGWEATMGCIDSCQTIESQVTVTPAPSVDGVVRICQGDTVTVDGTPVFPAGGTPVLEMKLPDGSVISGDTVTQTITDPGVYIYDFIVRDPLTGCRDRTIEDVVVIVSTTPDFTGTGADRDIICFGETVDITAMVQTQQFAAQIAPPEAGQTFLPDQAGSIYTTDISVEGFNPGQTFNAATDLQSVYIVIEHSYMGDLDIFLRAPNGVEVFLMEYPNGGGGTWLGEAIDVFPVTNVPGVGYRYDFTEVGTGTQSLAQAGQALPGAVPVPEGDYIPEGSFADFIGSDMNGDWEIVVVDNLSADNGWIFEWGLIFDPNVIPPNDRTYEPGEVSSTWTASPDIISTSTDGSVITVQPSIVGQNCYDIEFLDDFGCLYTEQVCVEMVAEVLTATPADIDTCASLNNTDVNLIPSGDFARNGLSQLEHRVTFYTDLTDAEAGNSSNITNTSAFPITADTDVYVRVENIRSGCFKIEPFTVTFSDVTVNPANDIVTCDTFPFDNSEAFDLTSEQSNLLGSQDPNSVDVLYYTSQAAADAGLAGTEIADPTAFPNTSPTQIIYVRIQDSSNAGCFETGTFEVEVTPVAPTTVITGLSTCDTFPFDGTSGFNLNDNDTLLLNGGVASDFNINFFTSEADALSGAGEIASSYDGADGEFVFARVTNIASGCAEIFSFDLEVTPVAAATPIAGIESCDTVPLDLVTDFDLSTADANVLNGNDPNLFTIAYFNSEADALAGVGELTMIYEGSDNETVFARSTDNATGCAEIFSFNLTVLSAPPVGTAPDLVECDTFPFDFRLEFDLALQDGAILDGLSIAEYSVGYYTSEANAFNDIDELPSLYEAADGEIIYARLSDNLTGCANVSSFTLTVEGCEVIFPEGFSPNNDGRNDTFQIPNIEQYPGFRLKVYNRYGSTVYETSGSNYEEFDGVPNSGLNSGDGLLPVGTYFYTLEFNTPGIQDVASWLYINY